MILVTIFLIFVVIRLYQRYHKTDKDAPKMIPIRSFIRIIFSNTDLWNIFLETGKLVSNMGGVAYSFFYEHGIRRLYVVTDPEDCMTILNACPLKAPTYHYYEPWLGTTGFLGLNSETSTKVSRKLLNNCLKPIHLEACMEQFNINAHKFVQNLSKHVDKGPINIVEDLKLFHLEQICDSLFPVDKQQIKHFENYQGAVSNYLINITRRFKIPFLQHEFIFNMSETKRKQDEFLKILHHVSDEVIRQRVQTLTDIDNNKREPYEPFIYIDSLIQEFVKGAFNKQQLRSEVDSILFAGFDPPSYTVLFALLWMGSYPQVQQRAYEEVTQILGDRKIVTKEDLVRMEYLEAVLKESMRVCPYTPLLQRQVEEDVKLKNCMLRTGSIVAVMSWQVHRHECWGPDAEEFRPERWLEKDQLPKPVVMLSFSEGARNCLGRRYSMLSMKVLLSLLIRNYSFKADCTKLRFKLIGVLEPLAGSHVAIERREQKT